MLRMMAKKKRRTQLFLSPKKEKCCAGKTRFQRCWLKTEFKNEESLLFRMNSQEVSEDARRHQRQKCCAIYVHLHAKNKLPRKHAKLFGSDVQAYNQYLAEHPQ